MNIELTNFINKQYQYGFETLIEKEKFPIGINNNIILKLSEKKEEPKFLTNFRLKAYKIWKKKYQPKWSFLKISNLNFNKIKYYSVPKSSNKNVPNLEILNTFNKLGVSLEQKNIAIDAVFDSVSITTTFQKNLAKYGIIFCSISKAIHKYPKLIEKYLGSAVSSSDNMFSALNSCIFTDGSFCYVPQNIKSPLDVSTYFRINDKEAGQFERTLIVAEKNSEISYLEGCTAIKYDNNLLHAAVVELIAKENAKIKYSTVQNWYPGNIKGEGGIYNFVTKRGICSSKKAEISWSQVETGSAITWKYPSCILLGDNSKGLFNSLSITTNYQQADTGTKMIHIGNNTYSKIISKGISAGYSKNIYRGLIKIYKNAKNTRAHSQCDSFILGSSALSATYPYFSIKNSLVKIEHEAKISKITEEQLFYLMQRGFSEEKAINIVISGFCKDIIENLPMEFALEANKLLSLKLEGSIG